MSETPVMEKKRILCVGLVCLDMISTVNEYPVEDSDQRCVSQYWQRGGNASNMCTVLSLLGASCELMGTMADTHELNFIKEDLASYGIPTDHCICHKERQCPISVCIVNQTNGSRTILHANRNLPEVTIDDFKTVDLTSGDYKWIHFEGRYTCSEIKKMLHHIEEYNQTAPPGERITTSVEVEKKRPELDMLLDQADYVFVGKDNAQFHGCSNKQQAVEYFQKKIRKGATVICPWGETGAVATSEDGHDYCQVPAYSPDKVVDTLGAGDSFIAASILALSSGKSLQAALDYGSHVAGAKCGIRGYRGLRELLSNHGDISKT